MLSKNVSSAIFKVFGMTLPGIEHRSSGLLANTRPTRPMTGVAPSPTPRCSSYWKRSLLVALYNGLQVCIWFYFSLMLIISNVSDFHIYKTVTVTNTLVQSGPGSNDKQSILNTSRIYSTLVSLSDAVKCHSKCT